MLGSWRRAEVLDEIAAERAGDEIADGDGQKCVAHVEALLAGRGEARDVFVVTRDLRDFAERDENQRDDEHRHRGMECGQHPADAGDEEAESHGGERGQLASDEGDCDLKTDYHDGVDGEQQGRRRHWD